MKTKIDLVTNSSSTSIVLIGKQFEKSELNEVFQTEDIYEEIDNKVLKCNLNYGIDYDGQTVYIGKSPFKMRDEQTLKQFKQEIVNDLHHLGFDVTINELENIEEVIYN